MEATLNVDTIDSNSVMKNNPFSTEFVDSYHINSVACLLCEHKKAPNYEDNPLCLHYLGENNVTDVLEDLKRVEDVAMSMIRSDGWPIGLINAQNTCYINVLLQSLYRIWPFRKIITSMKLKIDDESSVIYILQKCFTEMSLSKCLVYYPSDLINIMGINPAIQCDVHEFYDLLMTTIKSILLNQQMESNINDVDSLFSGTRFLCRCCMNCHNVFYQPDVFSFLDCSVINVPRLEDALQVLFTKERMSGSEQCNQKFDAEVLTKIMKLPPVLMIRMQRLQFDRGSGNQVKLTNGVQIPMSLDFANFSNLDSSVQTSDYCLISVIHHHGDHVSSGHYTCHVETDGKWYNINDNIVDEIACPYVDVKDHPWRPVKQPNMMFSVEPSSYHDISHSDGCVLSTGTYNSLNSSVVDIGDALCDTTGNSEIEALPFKVTHSTRKDVEKEKKKKKRGHKSKELEKWKTEKKAVRKRKTDEDAEEWITPSLRRTRRGTRKNTERCNGDEQGTIASPEDTTNPASLEDTTNTVSPEGIIDNVPSDSITNKGSQEGIIDSSSTEGIPCGALPGGSSRNRRMVSNNLTVQSAYMCFYIRKDVYASMTKEEKDCGQTLFSTIHSEDLTAIDKENRSLTSSIEEEFRMLIDLRETLSNRVEQYNDNIMHCSTTDGVFVPTEDLTRWVVGEDVIRPVLNKLEASRVVEKKLPADTVVETCGVSTDMLSTPVVLKTDSDYRDVEITESQEPLSMMEEVMESLRRCVEKKKKKGIKEKEEDIKEEKEEDKPDEKEDISQRGKEEKEEEITESSLCSHGRFDPIYFRTHYKHISETAYAVISSSYTLPITAIAADSVICEICQKFYTDILQSVITLQPEVVSLVETMQTLSKSRSVKKAAPTVTPSVNTVSEAALPAPELPIVSTQFVNSLKSVVRNRRRFLAHVDKFHVNQYKSIQLDILEPNQGLLCMHGMMKGYLRKMDYLSVPTDIWDRIHAIWPNCSTVKNSIVVCHACKRNRVIKPRSVTPVITKPLAIPHSPLIKSPPPPPSTIPSDSIDKKSRKKRGRNENVDDEFTLVRQRVGRTTRVADTVRPVIVIEPMTAQNINDKAIITIHADDMQKKGQFKVCLNLPSLQQSTQFPRGYDLYMRLFQNQLDPSEYYNSTISALLRKDLLNKTVGLLSLISRDSPITMSYFSSRPAINDGCYFLLSRRWLQDWRLWLRGDIDYENVKVMRFTKECQHGLNMIPGYMNNFIAGISSVPSIVDNKMSEGNDTDVELVNEEEMAILIKHHIVSQPYVGFFYGMTSVNTRELVYFPGLCHQCQENENEIYENRLYDVEMQVSIVVKSGLIPSVYEERQILTKSCNDVIITTVPTSTPISLWKAEFAKILNVNANSIHLFSRLYESIESGAISDYGINPETTIYIKLENTE